MKNKLIILFIFLGLAAPAQNYYNDAQLRTSLLLEKRVVERFSVLFNTQARWNMNMTNFNRLAADIGISYKVAKFLRLRANYVRILKKDKSGNFSSKNWYYAGATFKLEKDRWKFLYRNIVQVRYGAINSEDQNTIRIYDRNKFIVRYEVTKRFNAVVAEELYVPLNSPSVKGIDRARSIAGIEFKVTKNQELEFYFMHQAWLRKNPWFDQKNKYPNGMLRRDYIYGVSYSIAF